MLIGLLTAVTRKSFGELLASTSEGHVKCVSLKNGPCQIRPTLIDISSNETILSIHCPC